jgi:hypothetical protein
MALTEIYSGATYFGIPMTSYIVAFSIVMAMFVLPTLIALGWALTAGQARRPALHLVPSLDRFRRVRSREERDRAA